MVREGARFGLVVHGPEAVDTQLVARTIRCLAGHGSVKAVMSGYTGVAAVIDAGLEDVIDISRRYVPSKTLLALQRDCDVLLLVNSAKTADSALKFGSIVFSKVRGKMVKPLLQVDEGMVVDWTGGEHGLVALLCGELGLVEAFAPPEVKEPRGKWRSVGGVLPGENVWVNGVVVGRATSSEVRISSDEDGRLVAEGIDLKPTGVERLGRFNAKTAHVRSGIIRRTRARPRSLRAEGKGVRLIDHSAEDAVYDCRGCSLVVTVGDDTSRIAGNLLSRFGVPIVAITDGDEDGICGEAELAPGSVMIRLRPGTDDIVGAEVRKVIFEGRRSTGSGWTAPRVAEAVIGIAGDRFLWRKNA